MSAEAQRVADWATSNGLQLNEGKTKVILLGSEQYVRMLNSSNLPQV